MRCPFCAERDDKVIDSRSTEYGAAIRRRRVCNNCGRRFTTKERVEEEVRLTVIKHNGTRAPYRRDKIVGGIQNACYKLEISEVAIDAVADSVEGEIFKNHDREVSSKEIGEYVAIRLRGLNPVAYVRFMSVYQQFDGVEDFIEEIRKFQHHVAVDAPNQGELFST